MLLTIPLLLGLIPPGANVSISEIDCDTDGFDTLEFIELYDGGAGNTALDGFVLVLYNGGGSDSVLISADLDGFSTDANGYFLFGNSAVVPTPQLMLGDNSFQNGADAVALYVGNGDDFPFGAAVTSVGLVDAIVYDTNDDDDPELLLALDINNYGQINEDENGNKNFHSIQACPGGNINVTFPTPAADNDCPTTAPANDECANPFLVFEGANPIDNNNATDSQPFSCQASAGADVWYSFTPDRNASYTLSFCAGSATFDTVLALYSDCGSPAVDCDDDTCGVQSELTAVLNAGTTYLIQVGGFLGEQGTGILDITKNDGAVNYCVTSGATISYTGSTSIAADDFVLTATGLPLDTYLFQVGLDKAAPPFPFGLGGTQCIFMPCRLNPPVFASGSSVSRPVPLADYAIHGCPTPMVGSQRFYQCFFRFEGGTETTNALAVVFGP